jgi:hypothetical protein
MLQHALRNKICHVRLGVFKAVTMKNDVFLDVTPCGSCKNRCFGGTERLLHLGGVPSSSILVTLMKEALSSSEMSAPTRATWRNIPEDAILQDILCSLIKSKNRKDLYVFQQDTTKAYGETEAKFHPLFILGTVWM